MANSTPDECVLGVTGTFDHIAPLIHLDCVDAEPWFTIVPDSAVYSSYSVRNEHLPEDEDGFVSFRKDENVVCLIFDSNIASYVEEKTRRNIIRGIMESDDGPDGKHLNLNDCFDEFSKAEQLGEDDAWYCPQCKKHQQATKKLDIWKLPEVLVVHLKRFSHSRYRRDKLENVIDFPLNGLDLTSRVAHTNQGEECIYDLYAISNHFGGLGGGHYTAYAKNPISGKWFNFDDSSVSPVNDVEVLSRAAYVLYYRRRNHALPFQLPSPTSSVFSKTDESPIMSMKPASPIGDAMDELPVVGWAPSTSYDRPLTPLGHSPPSPATGFRLKNNNDVESDADSTTAQMEVE
jgi:hypothetical protein